LILDLVLALGALLFLVGVLLRLWHKVHAFGSAVSEAGDRLSQASAAVPQMQRSTPATDR
jgi:hypothetical protein